MPSIDRITTDELTGPGSDPVRPWAVVAWVAITAALVGGVAYLEMKPDAWDRYQKDFGCTAVSNTDSSYSRARCVAAGRASGEQLSANGCFSASGSPIASDCPDGKTPPR